MAESYIFEIEERPLALVSIQNDSVHFADEESRERNRFGHDINLPFTKRYNTIPAIKLGRIGVQKEFRRSGIGTNLLECCKYMFVNENRTGCRLILVDSYIRTMSFYEKNRFLLFPKQTFDRNRDDETVIMYCDLKPYQNL